MTEREYPGTRGCSMLQSLGPAAPSARDEYERLVRELCEAFKRVAFDISELLLGPRAPVRKRPRRVAKKIAARAGRSRYPGL